MKKHYELEYNFLEDGWQPVWGKYPTMKEAKTHIRQMSADKSSYRFTRYRVFKVTRKRVPLGKAKRKATKA